MTANEPQIGSRIKRLRRQRNISQADLAAALSISPSYLNLIEHNRRRTTVGLLLRAASYFGVDASELAEADGSRLAGDLMEIFGDDLFAEASLTNQDIRDLAASHPTAARAVVRLFDAYRSLRHGAVPHDPEAELDTAVDAVSDFLQEHGNHFPSLEAAAERIRHDIDLASDAFEHGLRTSLANVFGVRWRSAPLPGDAVRAFDAERSELVTSDALPYETTTFAAARELGRLAAGHEIAELIDEGGLPPEAAELSEAALAAYFAGALIMPYDGFLRACRETRYDIERLARRFRTSFEQVCHRMTTLQRPGASGIPLHLVRTDIAGNISKRFSLSGIHIPRHSGACPRWNIYGAFLSPERLSVQVSVMPDGSRYFCIARSMTKGGYRHNAPRQHLSIGLGCHISHAAEMVYSDGLALNDPGLVVPIGVGCQLCPRTDCAQRACPPSHRLSQPAAS
jgi:predicted transcriptional regulator/transcriptional regulator with XRE-family HTH domain